MENESPQTVNYELPSPLSKPKFIGSLRLRRGASVVAALGDRTVQPEPTPPTFTASDISRGDSQAVGYRILFAGSNEEHEIESMEEFFAKTKDQSIELRGWNFQAVDFSQMDIGTWNNYKWAGAIFLGCRFPSGITAEFLRGQECQVWQNPDNVPFVVFRALLYRQQEMEEIDSIIGDHYRNSSRDFHVRMAESMHDFSMRDALFDYLEGKTPVGIMGSHSLKRGSDHYAQLVYLARKLALLGFLVVTGGGAGAMEAANLGAYLVDKSDNEVEEALSIIRTGNDENEFEFLNAVPAINVIKRFGYPTVQLSLGIPTWRYSKEPFNRFSTFHAKFFSNALREDGLVHICRGGIIFGKGGPGTRQEVFQACCVNHEEADVMDQCPLVFLDHNFWKSNGVYDVVYNTSVDTPFHNDLLITDDLDEAANHLVKHALRKRLPLYKDLSQVRQNPW